MASLDIERTLAFFERIGFQRHGAYPEYGIVQRDNIELHFWLCFDSRIPRETGCRIVVEGIEALFEEMSRLKVVHPNGQLETKAWGVREFSILDVDGNLLTFQENAS